MVFPSKLDLFSNLINFPDFKRPLRISQSHFKSDYSNYKCNYIIRRSYILFVICGNYAKGSKLIFIKRTKIFKKAYSFY